jgi:hypothetical protein
MLPNKLSPNKLTDPQLVLLSAAPQREDGAIELTPNRKGGVAYKVVGKLLTQGLIEEIPARGALPVWRREEGKGPFALRITRRPCGHRGQRAQCVAGGRGTQRPRAKGPIPPPTSLPVGPLRRVASTPETWLCESRPSPAVRTQSRLKYSRCSSANMARQFPRS